VGGVCAVSDTPQQSESASKVDFKIPIQETVGKSFKEIPKYLIHSLFLEPVLKTALRKKGTELQSKDSAPYLAAGLSH
jgi:hypothetical protein